MELHPHKLWHFHGGLHLPAHKELSTQLPLLPAPLPAPLPARIVLPLQQHIGEPTQVLVKPGDQVLKGQLIAEAKDYVCAPIHASTSGTVIEVSEQRVPHPSGQRAPCIVIEPDGDDRWTDELPAALPDYHELDGATIRQRARACGIVGLGGAAFPTAVKLNPQHPIDTLILNGAECEPYISCDDTLMRTHAHDILEGLRIIRQATLANTCIIAVEADMPDALISLRNALGGDEVDGIRITSVPTIYPTGGERQLIKVLTGHEVPSDGLPLDIGVLCHNVGTAQAVYQAVAQGKPMLSRIVTVTGGGVKQPRNLEVLLGTPMAELIAACGGYTDSVERLIMGGPMMGFALESDEVPVIKSTNCILAAAKNEIAKPAPAMPCIRCGECARVCPARLLPQELYWHSMARDLDKTQDYNLFDCIECGCCAYVCPSNIPLVQYYRFAKTEVWAQERDKQASDIARRRHEFRLERLERIKQERAEKHARKKAALKQNKDASGDTGKAAIQAALERVRAKKAATQVQAKNIDNLTEAQRRKIEAVEKRRQEKQQTK